MAQGTFRGTIYARNIGNGVGTGELIAETEADPLSSRRRVRLIVLTNKNVEIVSFDVDAEDFYRLADLAQTVARG